MLLLTLRGTGSSWRSTGAVAPVPAAVTEFSYLLFDGTDFFIIGRQGATQTTSIARVPPGGPPVIVATLPYQSSGLAVDDACVYFGTPTGIFSLHKGAQNVVVP
jgi:hypothetical protein